MSSVFVLLPEFGLVAVEARSTDRCDDVWRGSLDYAVDGIL
jgi:hypothetical protein